MKQILKGLWMTAPQAGTRFFTNQFAKAGTKIVTKTDTVSLDAVPFSIKPAKIIKRGSELPQAETRGKKNIVIIPDYIAEFEHIRAEDSIMVVPGMPKEATSISDSSMYAYSSAVASLKNRVANTKEYLNAAALVNGAINQADGSALDFGFDAAVAKNYPATGKNTLAIFLQIITDFQKLGVMPTITVGMAVAQKLLSDDSFSTAVKAFGGTIGKVNPVTGNQALFSILGVDVLMMPTTKKIIYTAGVMGTADLTECENMVIAYSEMALAQVFAGIDTLGANGMPAMIASEEYLDIEIGSKSNTNSKVFVKSAYCPAVLKEYVQRYTFTA